MGPLAARAHSGTRWPSCVLLVRLSVSQQVGHCFHNLATSRTAQLEHWTVLGLGGGGELCLSFLYPLVLSIGYIVGSL